MNQKTVVIVVAAGVAVAIAIAFAVGAFNTGPPIPNVKFVAFGPEGRQTIKEGQTVSINFRVHNYEQRDITTARVFTTHEGDSQFFVVDKPDYTITPAIGARDGESGTQTVVIRGADLGGQSAVEDVFHIRLYVDGILIDAKELTIRLEP